MNYQNLLLLSVIFLAATVTASAQKNLYGIFDTATDVGNPKLNGSTIYDVSKQEYTLLGAGYNIWFNRDEFHFAAKRIKGDFIVTADFEFPNPGKELHRKYGWMVRENLNDDAAHFTATFHSDGLTAAQWRVMRGAYMRDPEDEIFFPKKKAQTIQIQRIGKTYTMRIANPSEPLQTFGAPVTMENIGNNPYVGIFISSHNADNLEAVRVWNVRIDKPVPANYKFYSPDSLGSRLEIIDVFSGKRKVVYESTHKFEAPNFLPDGKKILFNSKGLIWTVPVDGSAEPTQLNTGTIDKNNNDHVISHNGKLLGISSQRTGLFGGGSTIYFLPLEGGVPKLVTEKTPSYLHGWSANNKEVYFTARRDTNANSLFRLYKANIENGAETQLTHQTFGHVDGPEGSPDGKWIYFNGSMTGTMQLYRMKPDGTGQEQLTFDQFNNWFPHLSPDGKWIAYIAFENDINPTDHPPLKTVSLKLMSANGGFPKTIAHLYGGQGTINTPSWSPDSKYVSFVSYSGRVK